MFSSDWLSHAWVSLHEHVSQNQMTCPPSEEEEKSTHGPQMLKDWAAARFARHPGSDESILKPFNCSLQPLFTFHGFCLDSEYTSPFL